jgi:hypothetical protein
MTSTKGFLVELKPSKEFLVEVIMVKMLIECYNHAVDCKIYDYPHRSLMRLFLEEVRAELRALSRPSNEEGDPPFDGWVTPI